MQSASEAMIVEAIRAAVQTQPVSTVLLVGAQSCEVVREINALVGRENVYLLHLDRAHGGASCGFGNPERFLGDAAADEPPVSIVALDCAAARNYDLLRELVRQTSTQVVPDGLALVAGPKKGGAEAAAKVLREVFARVDLLTYRQGQRIYRASGPIRPSDGETPAPPDADQPDEPLIVTMRGQTLRLIQDRRIFARGRLDPATKLLAETFEAPAGSSLLDLGCGNGILGILAARLDPTSRCYLVDSDPIAVDVATRNAALNGAANVTVYLSDVLVALPGVTYDVVVMNPPFHRGRAQDASLAERFIGEARRALRDGGSVYVVCNRFLRYEPILERLVGPVTEAAGDTRYKVLLATHRARERRAPDSVARGLVPARKGKI